MPTITDWLMVIITLVYVIATIAICRANYKAATASKEQLVEMKRQYAEENRPRIEMELCYEHRSYYYLRFVNHGRTTAQRVKIDLSQEFIDNLPNKSFRESLERAKGKESIIGVDQHYDLYIADNELRNKPGLKPLRGIVSYESNGNKYETDLFLDLTQYMPFFSSTTDGDKMLQTIQSIESDLQEIKNTLITRHI